MPGRIQIDQDAAVSYLPQFEPDQIGRRVAEELQELEPRIVRIKCIAPQRDRGIDSKGQRSHVKIGPAIRRQGSLRRHQRMRLVDAG